MDVATEDGYSDGLVCSKVLEIFDQECPFGLVVFGGPVVVVYLDLAAVFVDQATEDACFAQRLAAVQDVLEHCLRHVSL